MTKSEFVQQVVITTLPRYFTMTKKVPRDYSTLMDMNDVYLTTEEAHDQCLADAIKLANKVWDKRAAYSDN